MSATNTHAKKELKKTQLKEKFMTKKMDRKIEVYEELQSHGLLVQEGLYENGQAVLNNIDKIIKNALKTATLGPNSDLTVKQIADHENFKKMKTEDKQTLTKILKICAERINYNEVFAKFYREESEESLKQHLGHLLSPALNGKECTQEIVQHVKKANSQLPMDDVKWYHHLLNVINQNLTDPKIYERIEKILSENLWDITWDEQQRPAWPKNMIWAPYYTQTAEYLEGREFDYVKEMLDSIKPYLSQKYQTFLEYNPLGGKRSTVEPNQRISKNHEYFKSLVKKIDELESSFRAIRKLKVEIKKKDRKKIADRIIDVLRGEINPLQKPSNDKYALYSQLQKTFDALYEIELKINKHFATAKALQATYQTIANDAKRKALEAQKASAPEASASGSNEVTLEDEYIFVQEVSVDEDSPVETSSRADKEAQSPPKVCPPKKEIDIKPLYFDYKTAFDKPKSSTTERRMSKDSSYLLAQLLTEDESTLPHFEITRDALDKLFEFLGGKYINKSGAKFRYELNDIWGDIPYFKVSLPQHGNHAKDDRNDTVSKYTLVQFRSLLVRAGVKEKMELLMHPKTTDSIKARQKQ